MDVEICSRRLKELDGAREELIKLVREVRIAATRAVAAIHSGNNWERLIEEAVRKFQDIKEFRKYPEIYYPITQEAVQELVEAAIFSKIVSGIEEGVDLDGLKGVLTVELDVEPSAFVTGLADVVGELRRYALSKLISGELEKAEAAIRVMETIHDELISMTSLPDKLVPGLRRKLDVARDSIERTKSDLIAARVSEALGKRAGYESLGGN